MRSKAQYYRWCPGMENEAEDWVALYTLSQEGRDREPEVPLNPRNNPDHFMDGIGWLC